MIQAAVLMLGLACACLVVWLSRVRGRLACMATGLGELAETGTLSHRTAQCLHASTPASAEHRMLQLADQLHGRRILFDQLAWRARELTGLRDIHDLTERSDLGQDELLARVAERLTRAMRWPDHAHVWIRGAGLAVGQPRPVF